LIWLFSSFISATTGWHSFYIVINLHCSNTKNYLIFIDQFTIMRLLLWFIPVTLIYSCNTATEQQEPFKSLLKNCDEVNINFYNGGDSIHFQTEDSLGIRVLTQSVSGNTEAINDSCKTAGEIIYRAKNDTLFRAEFAVVPASDKKTCDYITYNYQGKSYKNRLNDKAYQLLTQMYPKPSVDTVSSPDTLTSDSVR
jgi:hypothetical protein